MSEVPRAAERVLRLVFAALVAHLLSGTAWALLGWFHPVPTLMTSAALVVVLLRVWPRPEPATSPASAGAVAATAAAFAVVAAATLLNLANSSEHLVVDRDPGAYVTQGWWLAEHGEPRPPGLAGPFRSLAGSLPEVRASGPGYYEPDVGEPLDLQFFRGLPVLLATAGWLGRGALLAAPALLGGLGLAAVWWLAARLLRPATALAVVAGLAVSLPQFWFSRDAFTEPLTQALLFAALATGVRANDDYRYAGPAGLLLGATVIVRVDALLFLPGAALLLAADHIWSDRRAAGERTRRFALGLAAPLAIAGADIATLAREYVVELGPEVAGAAGLALLGAVSGALLVAGRRRWPDAGRWLADHRRGLGAVAAAVVALAGGALWLVRPHVQEASGASRFEKGQELVGFLQEAEGSPLSAQRTYDEQSLERLASYLGPVSVAAAVIGAAVLIYVLVAGRQGLRARPRTWLPLVLVTAGPGIVYLWRSGITPDQIWALRRFLPAAIPTLLVLAGFAVDRLWDAGPGTTTTPPVTTVAGRTAAVAVAVAMVALPAAASAPVLLVEHGSGQETAVTETCNALGPDAAVLFVSDRQPPRDPTVPTLAVFCELPVASVPAGAMSEEWMRGLAAEWAAQGRILWVLAGRQEHLPGSLAARAIPIFDATFPTLEQTLERRPNDEIIGRVRRWGYPVPSV